MYNTSNAADCMASTATDFRALLQRANLYDITEAAKIANVKPFTIRRILSNDGSKPSLAMLENVHSYYDKIVDYAYVYTADIINQFDIYDDAENCPDEIAIVVYKDPDYRTRFKDYSILPFASSHFLCMRISVEILSQDFIPSTECEVRLVTLAPDLYAEWLGDLQDIPEHRAQWAGTEGLNREMWVQNDK